MSLFRPEVDRIAGYVPGEQPQEAGWIKLNTNENPYPTSPRVVAAIEEAARGKLNLYPDPLANALRRQAAELFDVEPDCVLPANGSDEALTILLRAFVSSGELVAYPYPSYILYETLADIQGATHERLCLRPDWSWDFERYREAIERAKLVLVPNPNSPSGNRWSDEDILRLVPPRGVLVLDEAYGDFADRPHRAQLLKTEPGQRIVITRTLSKSYSLAGIRLGFAIASPELIAGMRKVKDSYNCNRLTLAAGAAALSDRDWMQSNVARIRTTRAGLSEALAGLGFDVVDSQANFVWCTHPGGRHREIYQALKSRKFLIRHMVFPEASGPGTATLDGLRITVGTDVEIDAFLKTLGEVLSIV